MFNYQVGQNIPEKLRLLPRFDARVYQYPTQELAAECFLWRETDATRNSLTMAAHAFYSHKELHKAGFSQKHDMLHAKGVNWNDYPAFFKRGTYVRRETVLKVFTPAELARIPANHQPTAPVPRSVVKEVDMPPLARVANVNDVLFRGAVPVELAAAPEQDPLVA